MASTPSSWSKPAHHDRRFTRDATAFQGRMEALGGTGRNSPDGAAGTVYTKAEEFGRELLR